MATVGQSAWFGNSIVKVMKVTGNNVFYKVISGKGEGNFGNTYSSELKILNPDEERSIRNKARLTRLNNRVNPTVAHHFPTNTCPECGTQNFVLGVRCPNCDFVQNESFKSWFLRQ